MATAHLPDSQQTAEQPAERAQPPIRWPHLVRSSVPTIALWALGLLVALLVPAMIVPLSQKTATVSAAWTAFSFTVLGAAMMIAATSWHFLRTRDSGILLLGLVPGVAVVLGGIMLATVKTLGFV
jgi:predicted membrane channel-forming protein YqfA (hemolysin III family)